MIFLDNASTTQINKEALDIYNYYSNNLYFNPSALYMKGAQINKDIKTVKQQFLKLLGANKFDNIIFTSCATESNNMVLNSFIKTKTKKALIGISEHPSIYNKAKTLLDNGYDIEFININSDGIIDIEDFKNKLTKDTTFVSIMHVNNETGAVNPIKTLVEISKKINNKIIFHSDGVQAFGKVDVDLEDLGVDLYTISAHKIYGPKGIGALYVKKGVNINPLLIGGGQEDNLRSGTENTPAIFAFAKSAEIAINNLDVNFEHASNLKTILEEKLRQLPYDLVINSNSNCSPYIISFAIANLRAETILRILEDYEILIGNGSACSSNKRGNRILEQMHINNKYIEGALRISFNNSTTEEDVLTFVEKLDSVIKEYKNNTNR